MRKAIGLATAGLLALAGVGTASAHHSFAIFDHNQTYLLKGKVKSFQWTNPHGYIDLEVKEGPPGIERYTLELTSINMLQRAGWKSSDVHPGDEVTALDCGESCHIEDVLLRVHRRYLSADLGQRIEHHRRESTETRVVGSEEAGRAGSDDGELGGHRE